MMLIVTILIFLLVLSVLVIFHELGHFLAARRFNVKVKEFGLGFPPRAKKLWTDKRGTLFSLNWLPIGGFVAMDGEDQPAETDALEEVEVEVEQPTNTTDQPFYVKPAWQRLLIILAGPVFSFLFGIICFIVLYGVHGIPQNYPQPRIVEVQPNSPAAAVNLPTEIAVWQVSAPDGQLFTPAADNLTDLIAFINQYPGQSLTFTTSGACEPETPVCDSTPQTFELYVRTTAEIPEGEGAIGIAFSDRYAQHYPWWQLPFVAVFYGLKQSLELIWLILGALGQMLTSLFQGQGAGLEVAGPVGMVALVQKEGIFAQGIWSIISFAAMLSINLGVMNLLPFPALDGGRAVLILLEKVISRTKIAKIEGILNAVGFIALILLMVFVTFNDIAKLVMGS